MSISKVTAGEQAAARIQRHHRDSDECRSHQVRGRQGIRRAVRGPIHDDRDALPGELRLRAADDSPRTRIQSMCWCTRRFPCIRGWWSAAARSACCAWKMKPGATPKCSRCPRTIFARYFPTGNRSRTCPRCGLQQIRHFFEHYKDLEPGKWVRVIGWSDLAAAHEEISSGARRYATSRPAAP